MYFIHIITTMIFFSCVLAKSEECFIKEFSSNVTVEVNDYRKIINAQDHNIVILYKEGSLLRLNCQTNCAHFWTYSPSVQEEDERVQVFSQFINPPYFYIMVSHQLYQIIFINFVCISCRQFLLKKQATTNAI